MRRLRAQAHFIEPITRQFLLTAGVAPGMRVLDVGSGAGDVAFLARDLVGATGEVVGIDRAPAAVAAADDRANALGLRNVSFELGDVAELEFATPFDAVIGRYVLAFQPDPSRAVRRLVTQLKPSGLVVFQEPDWTGARAAPPSRTYEQCCRWVLEAARRSGALLEHGRQAARRLHRSRRGGHRNAHADFHRRPSCDGGMA